MKPPEPDAAFEISLRPPAFSEFNGQVKVRERLELMVEAAKKRGDVLEHTLERTVRTRQDDARLHHRQRDGREYQKHQRTCH